MPRLDPDAWERIRIANIAGESYRSLAERFGVSANAIHKRARREGWGGAPKVDAPKVDAPKVDAPKVDAPKALRPLALRAADLFANQLAYVESLPPAERSGPTDVLVKLGSLLSRRELFAEPEQEKAPTVPSSEDIARWREQVGL